MMIWSELIALFLPLAALALSLFIPNPRFKLPLLVFGQVTAFTASAVGLPLFFLAGNWLDHSVIKLIPGFFEIQIDALSVCTILLVTMISTVVTRFSEQLLVGDPSRQRFVQGIVLLASLAKFLVSSQNLALSLLCWVGISVMLWLMTGMRKGGTSAARTVLVHHLISDALFASAAAVIISVCHTWDLSQINGHASLLLQNFQFHGKTFPFSAAALAGTLLVFSMAIKTALFPFHRWLIATLEAHKPLSGLLHAGIVNVAAIVSWRVFPVLAEVPFTLVLWGVLALTSTVVGTLVSSTQSDVGRKLVYSTIGQMGFMSLQCAVGALPAAVFHLAAHGLFKCHLFLGSGNAVSEGSMKRRWSFAFTGEESPPKKIFGWILVGLVVLPALYWLVIDVSSGSKSSLSVLIMTGAMATTLPALKRIGTGMFFLAGLGFVGAVVAARFLSDTFDVYSAAPVFNAQWILVVLIVALALTSFAIEVTRGKKSGQRLYVWALNGFYLQEWVSAWSMRFATYRYSCKQFVSKLFRKKRS